MEIIADLKTINPFDFFVDDYSKDFPFEYEKNLKKELLPYLEIVDSGKLMQEFLKKIPNRKKNIIDFLVDVNSMINKYINYNIRFDPGFSQVRRH